MLFTEVLITYLSGHTAAQGMVRIVCSKIPQQVGQQQLCEGRLAGGHLAAGAQRAGHSVRHECISKAAHPLLVCNAFQAEQLRTAQPIQVLWHHRRRRGICRLGVALCKDLHVHELSSVQLCQCRSAVLPSEQPPAQSSRTQGGL